MPAEPTADPAGSPGSPPLGRALLAYSALRLGLMAVLSVVAWLAGLPWLPATATGVVVAAILSLFVLKRPMQRLSAAISGARAARPATRPAAGAAADPYQLEEADDPYADDPYAEDPYADDTERRDETGTQDETSSATPISRP